MSELLIPITRETDYLSDTTSVRISFLTIGIDTKSMPYTILHSIFFRVFDNIYEFYPSKHDYMTVTLSECNAKYNTRYTRNAPDHIRVGSNFLLV